MLMDEVAKYVAILVVVVALMSIILFFAKKVKASGSDLIDTAGTTAEKQLSYD